MTFSLGRNSSFAGLFVHRRCGGRAFLDGKSALGSLPYRPLPRSYTPAMPRHTPRRRLLHPNPLQANLLEGLTPPAM
jgi:hypothetical protein